MKNTAEQNKLIQDWLAFARENLLYAKAGIKEGSFCALSYDLFSLPRKR